MSVDFVPMQVPVHGVRFFNRVDELAAAHRARAALADDRAVIVFVGLPGVGKSTLAAEFVDRIADDFPGGVLHVGFPDRSDETTVHGELTSCLREYGISGEAMPSTLADLTRRFRTVTGRPTLVLLDNVTSTAQVEPFMPRARGSVVVVTSRSRLSGLRVDGVPIEVVPFDTGMSREFLRQRLGREVAGDPAVDTLIDAASGLMTVLDLVARRLAGRRVGLAAELAAGAASGDGVPQARLTGLFNAVYQRLSEPAATGFTLLGALPVSSVSQDLAREVLGLSGADIDELVEFALVDEDRRTGRLRIPGVIARFARDRAGTRLTTGELDRVTESAVRYLAARTAAADLTLMGPGRLRIARAGELADGFRFPDRAAAVDWLEAERGNILTAVRTAHAHGWHELCWSLAECATALYVTRRYLLDWTETAELGAASAAAAGHREAGARLRSFASRAWTDLGGVDRAGRELREATELISDTTDDRLAASVAEMWGRWHDVTDPARAVADYERAIGLFRRRDDRRGIAFVTFFLGASHLRAGDPGRARPVLTEAVALITEETRHSGPRMLGRALAALGECEWRLGEASGAATLAHAVELFRSSPGDVHYEAGALWTLTRMVDRATAERLLARACGLLRDAGRQPAPDRGGPSPLS